MFCKQSASLSWFVIILALTLWSCNLFTPAPVNMTPAPATWAPDIGFMPTNTTSAVATNTPSTEPTNTSSSSSVSSNGMQLRFINLTDSDTVSTTLDANGRPLVMVQVEVTGKAPMVVDLEANGLPAVDEVGQIVEALNTKGVLPFIAEIPWSPPNGGGEYTLVATALDNDKQIAEVTAHVTVTGVATFTPLPPPLSQEQTTRRVSELFQEKYSVTIPAPSLQRFDFPKNPTRSRWIAAAYYKGMRYYVQIFDDAHIEWSNGEYSDTTHRLNKDIYFCRPAGTYRVLVIFVDYGNTGTVREDALVKVPVVVDWLNGLYTSFATSQGFASAPLRIEADAAYVASPPVLGELLTAEQISTLAGKNPSSYDFLMQIDLDVNATYAARYFSDFLIPGGGIALQGCGANKFGVINIWSSVTDSRDLLGGLVMDFNHELSHLFGMMDDWPPQLGATGPEGIPADDWIPYVLFGWTDTDGDGIPEIIDPTPYGTTGPQP